MQNASDALGLALEAGSVTWAHYLGADWEDNGFADDEGDNTIGDLSGQMGSMTVQHSMDDGMPDEISFMSGGVPQLRANLGGKDDKMHRSPLTPTQYFSPFRTDSPLYGLERDVAPVVGEIGAATLTGVEQVTVFTGSMEDIPVSGGRAALHAGSQTRRDMSLVVQPPPCSRNHVPAVNVPVGLTATHLITWALAQAEVFPAPPPQAGTFFYLPLHGSGHAQFPSTVLKWKQAQPGLTFGFRVVTGPTVDYPDPKWIRGPYVGASYGQFTAAEVRGVYGVKVDFNVQSTDDRYIGMDAGSIWDQTVITNAAVTRLEFYVRGDTTVAASAAPGGAAYYPDMHPGVYPGTSSQLVGFSLRLDGKVSGLTMGIDDSRNLYVSCWDNTGSNHKVTGPALPSDGEWHFVGLAIQGSSRTVWFNLDGTVTSSTFASPIVTANLPATRNTVSDGDYVWTFQSYMPTAEVHLSGFTDDPGDPLVAHPTSGNPWVNAQDWTQKAFVYPSCLQLAASFDPTPVEVFQYIAEFAQCELAAMRIDEHDLFHYWPRGYLATTAGQETTQVLDSSNDSDVPDVALDKTRIRTVCRVSYQDVRHEDTVNVLVLAYNSLLVFPPGFDAQFSVAFDDPAVWVLAGPMELLTAAQVAGVGAPETSFMSLNSDVDALGSYATSAEVAVSIVDYWGGGCTIELTNLTGNNWYLINDGDTYPALGIYGQKVISSPAAVTEQYDAGVDLRGVRGITLNRPRIQRAEDATRLARRVVVPQSVPTPIAKMSLFGDPRRQPGDIVRYEDDTETGAAGLWRVYALGHQYSGASYTQEATMQRADLVGTWGDGVSTWGSGVWAGQEV